MDNSFWLASTLMSVTALLFVLVPVIFKRKIQHDAERHELQERERVNVLIFKERLRELASDLAAGSISQQDFDGLKQELEDGLIDDVDSLAVSQTHNASLGGQKFQIGVLVLLAAVSIPSAYFLYDRWGAYDDVLAQNEALGSQIELEQAVARAEAGDSRALLSHLRQKLETSPDNIEGWALLARSAMAVQDYAMAVEAYKKLSVLEQEPEVRASVFGLLAQAYYFSGRPIDDPLTAQALNQAYAISPDEANSLGLQAIASFQEGRFAEAVLYWRRILTVSPDHPQKATIEMGIERAEYLALESGQSIESKGLVAGVDVAAGSVDADVPAENTSTSDLKSINVRVTAPDSARESFPADATVFVFAKAVSGPPLPLAVKKLMLSDLPITLTLDDSLAMRPELALSKFDRVNVVARISRSGQPIAGSGDVEGSVNNVALGTDELILVEINSAL